MNFYTCSDSSDIKADLPITQYKGEITEVTRLDDGTIAFTESLPLGNQQQRLISSDSIFLGTIEKARLFYPSQLVFVGDVSAAQTLFFRHLEKPESESSNKESNPQPTPEIQQKMNTSLDILKRFSENLNDARISEREASHTRTLEKQLRDLQEEYRLLEAKQQKLTSDHEALIQLKEEVSLGHLSDIENMRQHINTLTLENTKLTQTRESFDTSLKDWNR